MRTVALRERSRSKILLHARGHGNDAAMAAMVLSARYGNSALGGWLGLSATGFHALRRHHFPGVRLPCGLRSTLRRPSSRSLEWQDLRKLLYRHRAGRDVSELFVADIVCSACLGSDHLWQDLGLFDRSELSALMVRNFPKLAALNVHDMKWKKFLYKQLCIAQGVYTCRAPSCEECTDYDLCFGPED